MKYQINKLINIFTICLMLCMLASATVIESIKGNPFAHTYIYGTWWFVGCWLVIAVSTGVYFLQKNTKKHPIIFLFYLAFFLILLGAGLTFTTSVQGQLHLRTGKSANTFTEKITNSVHPLPFEVMLSDFQIQYYAGTTAPMDYVSTLKIRHNGKETTGQASMNTVFSQQGFRFYQSGYDRDKQGAILLVKSDKYGLPITYLGYFLLFFAIIAYFFSKNTAFRAWLKHPAVKKSVFLGLFFLITKGIAVAETKNTVPKDIAEKMGEIQLLYRDRVCPLETFARDFTLKLYGKSTYKSLSSEQVVCAWLFYPEDWKDEAIIKIKDKKVQQLLGINGKYASFSDFFTNETTYKLAESLTKIRFGEPVESAKNIIAADEKIQLLWMLQTGVLLKVFPIGNQEGVIWYSPEDELLESLTENEQLLIRGYFDLLREYAVEKNWTAMKTTLNQLVVFQQKMGKNGLLSPHKIRAEHLYNKINTTKPIAFCNLFIGLFALLYFWGREWKCPNFSLANSRLIPLLLNSFILFGALFLLFLICLRGYISGRIPLGNGFETMQFLACSILFSAFFFRQKSFLLLPFGFIFSGLVLLVAVMGISNPQITQLQPVLLSPLLSIHVSLIMIAYTLFGFIAFNSLASFLYFFLKKTKKRVNVGKKIVQLYVISRIFLYPAVFFFAGGIVVGAIWAEVSWGRYWAWDAKETWALITLIIYALPLHFTDMTCFQKPLFFHLYMLLAFLSVLMTYFGVNFVLGGLHSYN